MRKGGDSYRLWGVTHKGADYFGGWAGPQPAGGEQLYCA